MKKHIQITPEIAREYLRNNTRNRIVSQHHVDYLACEMEAGRFKDTGAPIAFRPDKTLGNGQHTLLAIVQSGVTVALPVWWDIPDEVIEAMDQGRKRSVAHQLQLADGLANSNLIAGAAKSIVSICCYNQNFAVGVGLTRGVITEFAAEIDAVIPAIRPFKPANRVWVVGALAFAMSADKGVLPFIEQLGSGHNIKSGDPAGAVRQWMTNGGIRLKGGYNAPKIEGLLNAAYNALQGDRLSCIKKGAQGIDYFLGKRRRYVSEIREHVKQQIAA